MSRIMNSALAAVLPLLWATAAHAGLPATPVGKVPVPGALALVGIGAAVAAIVAVRSRRK